MDAAEISAWRRQLRPQLLAARAALSVGAHHEASLRITGFLAGHFAARPAASLGFYWPFRREFDPRPFIETYVAGGRSAALPVVMGKGQPLEFRPWLPGCAMETGVYDILHPADGPVVQPDALLVPLLGFDAAGYRLGYGGGYYDITLAGSDPRPVTIGVGFEIGRVESIHPQPYDIPMDFVVTEAGIAPTPTLPCKQGRA